MNLGFILAAVGLCAGSLNLIDIVLAQKDVFFCWFLFPYVVIFFIVMLAETNRIPFDLAEAESEIVAGYNVEYSGIMFALFFLAEYSNMLIMSSLSVIFFFVGWLPILNFLDFIPPFF